MEVRRTTFRSFAAFTSFCKPLLNKLAYLGITKTFAEQPTPDLRSGMRGKVFANDLAFVVIVYPSCKRGVQGKVGRTCDALDKRICLRVAVKHYPSGVRLRMPSPAPRDASWGSAECSENCEASERSSAEPSLARERSASVFWHEKTSPLEKDEPTLKRWVLAAGFIAFVSTETNP